MFAYKVEHKERGQGTVVGHSWDGIRTHQDMTHGETRKMIRIAREAGDEPDTATVRFGAEDETGFITSVRMNELEKIETPTPDVIEAL